MLYAFYVSSLQRIAQQEGHAAIPFIRNFFEDRALGFAHVAMREGFVRVLKRETSEFDKRRNNAIVDVLHEMDHWRCVCHHRPFLEFDLTVSGYAIPFQNRFTPAKHPFKSIL